MTKKRAEVIITPAHCLYINGKGDPVLNEKDVKAIERYLDMTSDKNNIKAAHAKDELLSSLSEDITQIRIF